MFSLLQVMCVIFIYLFLVDYKREMLSGVSLVSTVWVRYRTVPIYSTVKKMDQIHLLFSFWCFPSVTFSFYFPSLFIPFCVQRSKIEIPFVKSNKYNVFKYTGHRMRSWSQVPLRSRGPKQLWTVSHSHICLPTMVTICKVQLVFRVLARVWLPVSIQTLNSVQTWRGNRVWIDPETETKLLIKFWQININPSKIINTPTNLLLLLNVFYLHCSG